MKKNLPLFLLLFASLFSFAQEKLPQNSYLRDGVTLLPVLGRAPQLSGMNPWVLADFRSHRRKLFPYQKGWNRKGLISETSNKKKAFYTLQKFYKNLKLDLKTKPF